MPHLPPKRQLFLAFVEFLEGAVGVLSFWRGDLLGFYVDLHDRRCIEIFLGDGRPLTGRTVGTRIRSWG